MRGSITTFNLSFCRQNTPRKSEELMKLAKLVLTTTMVMYLTLIVMAQLPQKGQPQPAPKQDQDRIEAAHEHLLKGQDKAAEASRLTKEVASARPGAGA